MIPEGWKVDFVNDAILGTNQGLAHETLAALFRTAGRSSSNEPQTSPLDLLSTQVSIMDTALEAGIRSLVSLWLCFCAHNLVPARLVMSVESWKPEGNMSNESGTTHSGADQGGLMCTKKWLCSCFQIRGIVIETFVMTSATLHPGGICRVHGTRHQPLAAWLVHVVSCMMQRFNEVYIVVDERHGSFLGAMCGDDHLLYSDRSSAMCTWH